jgi:hypothetical protein
LFAAQTPDLEYASSANNSTVVSERSSTDKLDSALPANNTDLKSATGVQQENTDDELQLYNLLLFNGQFKPYAHKLIMLAEISDESARMNFIIDRSDLQFSMNQFRSMEDDRLATVNLVHGTVTTLFVGASAGIAAWCVGGSYLISIVASSMPTWSGFDVIHIVNHPTRIKASDDESVAQIISADLRPRTKS